MLRSLFSVSCSSQEASHFCCTVLKQRADTDTVMAIMGHRSHVMTEHYSDHDTQEKFNNMRNVISGAWEKYLSA